jgi:hypothetical protein
MPRHFIFLIALIPVMPARTLAQDAPKAEPPAKRLPLKVMQAWENAEKKVQKNREFYDSANAKALEGFQKEVEKIKPPVNVDELVLQFQKEAIVALDAHAKPPVLPVRELGAGIVVFNGHKYKLFLENVSWDEAKQKCEDLGGHVLVVESGAEQAFIVKALNDLRARQPEFPAVPLVWLGIVPDKATGKWVSMVTGQPQLYSNWDHGSGQPRAGAESSAMSATDGRWYSRGGTNLVVCEWDK